VRGQLRELVWFLKFSTKMSSFRLGGPGFSVSQMVCQAHLDRCGHGISGDESRDRSGRVCCYYCCCRCRYFSWFNDEKELLAGLPSAFSVRN